MNIDLNHGFYVISDTHFYHSRLAFEFGLRTQFKDVEEMNATIFDNWNTTISDNDTVFFLGDFVIGHHNKYGTSQIIWDGLNGNKYFLKGSHDDHTKDLTKIPVIEDKEIIVTYRGMKILMTHEPRFTFEQDINICGHFHNNPENELLKWNMFNVGVEMIDYKPIYVDDVIQKIKDRAYAIYDRANGFLKEVL